MLFENSIIVRVACLTVIESLYTHFYAILPFAKRFDDQKELVGRIMLALRGKVRCQAEAPTCSSLGSVDTICFGSMSGP